MHYLVDQLDPAQGGVGSEQQKHKHEQQKLTKQESQESQESQEPQQQQQQLQRLQQLHQLQQLQQQGQPQQQQQQLQQQHQHQHLPTHFYPLDSNTTEYNRPFITPTQCSPPPSHPHSSSTSTSSLLVPANASPPLPIALDPAATATATTAAAGTCTHYNILPAGALLPTRPRLRHHHLDHPQHHHFPPPSASPPYHLQSQRHHPIYPWPFHAPSVQHLLYRLGTMESENEHDMAAQQDAAKNYQPSLDGPVIADRTPIAAVTEAYAKADPVYVEKTMALPLTYLEYRPVTGDGNCGWRAIGFSYFEKLVESGNADQIDGEAARLMSMNPLLRTVGGYEYYEDWADEAIGLLRQLADCVTDRAQAQALIHDRWTDMATSSNLIYYLRLLVATYLKANAAKFEAFVPEGQDISSYCAQSIELLNREIDHLGITALFECLVQPVDFVLEIAYLDRSPGTTANVYRFPEEANNQPVTALGPIICLLYRPDHYDILYRDGSSLAATSPAPVTLQINRASELHNNASITSTHTSLGAFATADFSLLATLPSAPSSSMSSSLLSPQDTNGNSCSPYVSPQQWPPGPYSSAPCASPQQQTPAGPPFESSHRSSATRHLEPMPSSFSAQPWQCSIRFTRSHYNREGEDQFDSGRFNVQTTTFKNSIWNRAHFGNPEFHPEQWCPGDEHADGRVRSRRRRVPKEESRF